MNHRTCSSLILGLAACLLVASCSSVPGPSQVPGTAPPAAVAGRVDASEHPDGKALAEEYARLGAAGGRVIQLEPAASQVRIYAFRGGRAPKLGHNHVLSAPAFEGYFHLPDAGPSGARFDLRFRLDQLAFDLPVHRAALGAAFASELSESERQGTRANMLGENYFQADRYPVVRLHSLAIVGEAPRFAVKVAVELHGQTREIWVPLTVSGLPQRLHVQGAFVLRQTDFGVQPYSVLGGLLAVQDEVVVEFTLTGA